jgi:hypothetical protein
VPAQTPLVQLSLSVHALPSLQLVPSWTAGLEHCPFEGLHTPTAWHWSDAVQVTGLEPTQAPDWQASVWVQALKSLQAVPSGCPSHSTIRSEMQVPPWRT